VELISLLPDKPVAYLSVKKIDDIITAFETTEFGNQVKKLPVLKMIGTAPIWRDIIYQKRLWEYEMQGRANRELLRSIVGKEAILSFYNRDGFTFLLISEISSKSKLQISISEATDSIDARYKMIREPYSGIDVITVLGFPREFSYAFIGKIGMLSTELPLIKEAIDIYKGRKKGFVKQNEYNKLIRTTYQSNSNSVYFNLSEYPNQWPLRNVFPDNIKIWLFSNRFQKGRLTSEHHFVLEKPVKHAASLFLRFVYGANEQAVRSISANDCPVKKELVSLEIPELIPADYVIFGCFGIDCEELWKWLKSKVDLEMSDEKKKLSDYLGRQISILLLPSDQTSSMLSIAFILPKTNKDGIQEALNRLADSISLNNKKIKILESETYKNVKISVFQLPFGLLKFLKCGYAVVNSELVVGLPLEAIKKIVDVSVDEPKKNNNKGCPYNYTAYPERNAIDLQGAGYLVIHPDLLALEIRHIANFWALAARLSGDKAARQTAEMLSENLFPLESLGRIIINFGLDGRHTVRVTVFIKCGDNRES